MGVVKIGTSICSCKLVEQVTYRHNVRRNSFSTPGVTKNFIDLTRTLLFVYEPLPLQLNQKFTPVCIYIYDISIHQKIEAVPINLRTAVYLVTAWHLCNQQEDNVSDVCSYTADISHHLLYILRLTVWTANFSFILISYTIRNINTVGIRCADHATPLYPQKVVLNFANKWRSLSRYSSLAD
jgi:hypothetical protein